MPDISELNGNPIANMSEFDGIPFYDLFTGLLDTYTGAAAAYSTRKLKSGVTVAARIRRSGDDIEADVEFDSNNQISLTSPISNASSGTYTDLADFVDHSTTPRDAFCVEWKDQSGNGNDATQPTAGGSGLQPKMYDATTGLITENGKPALSFNSDGFAPITGSKSDILFHTSTQGMLYNVGNYTASQNQLRLIAETNGTSSNKSGFTFGVDDRASTGNNDYGYYSVSKGVGATGAIIASSEASFVGAQYLMAIHYDLATGIFQYQNGSLLDSFSGSTTYGTGDATNDLAIGSLAGNYTYSLVGKMQELILYNADDTNRTGIESDINTEYLIYQPTTQPTSGLLYDYGSATGGTDAAAAYSVRQLSDKAVICMRIRRDSDDEERNIGFDSNGDLDTTAISDFCGTANGYVTRWWDQSVNGNHADQSVGGTTPQQPLIYDGTTQSVFEEGSTGNEKPTLKFLYSGIGNLPTLDFTSVDAQGAFTVCRPETLNVGGANCVIGQANLVGLAAAGDSGGRTARAFTNSGTLNITALGALTDQCFLAFNSNGTNGSLEYNGANEVTGGAQAMTVDAIGGTRIGAVTTLRLEGNAQEIILYETDQTTNRSGIESNVNTYFQIF